MAQMPIEIVAVGAIPSNFLNEAISLANSLQNQFVYMLMSDDDSRYLQIHSFRQSKASSFLDTMEKFKASIRGYHPYIIAFIDSILEGDTYSNLFGSSRAKKRLAVATVANVPGIIIPPDKMGSYFLYYIARYTLGFIAPNQRNHEDTRECVFDRKIDKEDIRKSMKERSLCDDCRAELVSEHSSISPLQLKAIDVMLAKCGELIDKRIEDGEGRKTLPRIFIGSSVEGLRVAEVIQLALEHVAECTIWSQGVFGLSMGTLESLVQGVSRAAFKSV